MFEFRPADDRFPLFYIRTYDVFCIRNFRLKLYKARGYKLHTIHGLQDQSILYAILYELSAISEISVHRATSYSSNTMSRLKNSPGKLMNAYPNRAQVSKYQNSNKLTVWISVIWML